MSLTLVQGVSGAYLFHVDERAVADPGDEISIQTRFRSRMKMDAPTVRLFAIPNAADRTAWAMMQAKREGLLAGFPDIGVLWNGGHAFLEFKSKTGSLDVNQIANLNWLHQAGHPCGVFRSVETAVAFLRRLGAPFLAAAA